MNANPGFERSRDFYWIILPIQRIINTKIYAHHSLYIRSKIRPMKNGIVLICILLSSWGVCAQDNHLQRDLIKIQTDFISHCANGDFDSTQELLHPWGCYFYHHGKIPPCLFNKESLEKIANPLFSWGEDDCYEWANDSVVSSAKIVTGMFWLDTLQSFTQKTPQLYGNYGALAYGFTGHYSSNHINVDKILEDHPNEFDGKPIKVLYTEHNTLEGYEVLMMEFFQDDNGDWKIYAIGELYWTP